MNERPNIGRVIWRHDPRAAIAWLEPATGKTTSLKEPS